MLSIIFVATLKVVCLTDNLELCIKESQILGEQLNCKIEEIEREYIEFPKNKIVYNVVFHCEAD